MELIYAWINDKKDIFFKNHQLNFSPNWDLNFNDVTKILHIEELEKQMSSTFFEENGKISNITAIIGENGSGKTRLLRRIGEVIANPNKHKYSSIVAFLEGTLIKVFAKKMGKIEYKGYDNVKVNYLENNKEQSADSIKILYYSPIFEGNIGGGINVGSKDIQRRNRYIKIKEFWDISVNNIMHGFQQIVKQYDELEASGYLHQQIIETSSKLSLSPYIIDFYFNFRFFFEIEGYFFSGFVPKVIDFVPNYISIMTDFPYGLFRMETADDFIHEISSDQSKFFRFGLIYWMQQNLICHTIYSFDELFLQKDFLSYRAYFIEKLEEKEEAHHLAFYLKVEEAINKEIISFDRVKSIGIIDIDKHEEDFKDLFSHYKKTLFLVKAGMGMAGLKDYYLRIHWGNLWKKPFSTWQQVVFSIYGSLTYAATTERKETLILLLDECDLTGHPEAQRNFLTDLLEFIPRIFCKELNQSVQIILTSHSPYIISNLPNRNVILLSKKDGQCVTSNDFQKNTKTFGAHINTLLSDSFFMKQKIGSFAEQKINDIIQKLSKKTQLTKDEKYIVEVLGEPLISQFIKSELQKQTEAEMIQQKNSRIKELELKIQKMENGQYSK